MNNIPNTKNSDIIREFYHFMRNSNAGEKHINNNLKIVMSFNNSLEQDFVFENVRRSHILNFLDSKIKLTEEDPDKRWITTWNVYLNHLKYFLDCLCKQQT